MTAPRTALFQRKGPPTGATKPAITIAIGHGDAGPKGQPPDESGPDAGDGAPGDPVQCQNCGCMIDPKDGSVVSQPNDDKQGPPPDAGDSGGPPGGGDVGSKLAAMMGGGSQ